MAKGEAEVASSSHKYSSNESSEVEVIHYDDDDDVSIPQLCQPFLMIKSV